MKTVVAVPLPDLPDSSFHQLLKYALKCAAEAVPYVFRSPVSGSKCVSLVLVGSFIKETDFKKGKRVKFILFVH